MNGEESTDGVRVPAADLSQMLICPRCKVDRKQAPCGDPHYGVCPMTGIASGVQVMGPKLCNYCGVVVDSGMVCTTDGEFNHCQNKQIGEAIGGVVACPGGCEVGLIGDTPETQRVCPACDGTGVAPSLKDEAIQRLYEASKDPLSEREALRMLVGVLREYGTFPPRVVSALLAAERTLGVQGLQANPVADQSAANLNDNADGVVVDHHQGPKPSDADASKDRP